MQRVLFDRVNTLPISMERPKAITQCDLNKRQDSEPKGARLNVSQVVQAATPVA
jgi:hypothetical protein